MEILQRIISLYEARIRSGQNSEGDLNIEHILENNTIIRRQIEVFDIYKTYLQEKSRFLDWGCKHAVDAYAIRMTFSDGVEIHGCDVNEEKDGILYEEAKLIYSQLTHPYHLPYEDSYFDAVIGSGVLEHVPNDYESLKELYRILKAEGYLIITFLPNHLSYTEALNRCLNDRGHLRKYSMRKIKELLLHTGFVPIHWGYHQLFPSLSSWSSPNHFNRLHIFQRTIARLYDLNQYGEKIWLINKLAANIFVVAQKRCVM